MEDHLEIRLQQPPWRNPRFVGDFEHALVIAYRTLDSDKKDLIPIQAAAIADTRVACADAEYIELTVGKEAFKGEAGVDLEADQITIGRGIADAKEGSQSLCRSVRPPPQHLIHHQIRPEIPVMRGRDAVARRVGAGMSGRIAAKIGKIRRMMPSAKFDIAERGRRNRLLVKRIGKFCNGEPAALANQAVGAAPRCGLADLPIQAVRDCR
jgi:hypothetical protein